MTNTLPAITLIRKGAIGTVVINNPKRRNAICQSMWEQLVEVIADIEVDSSVRVVIVRGAGEQAFSAGADISEFSSLVKDPQRLAANNKVVQRAQAALENLNRPTIAMIRGACVGGGCGLALACDFRFAEQGAKFAITPAKLGLLYSVRDTRRLYNLVGPGLTREMLYTGKMLTSEQAFDAGLLMSLTDSEQLLSKVDAFAAQLAAGSQYSIRGIKSVLALIEGHPTYTDKDIDELFEKAFSAEDSVEGAAAFIDKRPANFTWG